MRIIAESGVGVAWLVDEVEELDPPELVFARAVVGFEDASVWVANARAEVTDVESALLAPVVLDKTLVELVGSADPDEGVNVDCVPLVIADALPETLCACAAVPELAWI